MQQRKRVAAEEEEESNNESLEIKKSKYTEKRFKKLFI